MSARSAPIAALAAIGTLLAATTSVLPALASTPSPAQGQAPAVTTADVPERAADKITPSVKARLDAKHSGDFWIRFADTSDLEPAKDIADWAERGRFVHDALTRTATAAQADVVADLEAADADYESYWISNAILVKDGTLELARQAAASGEVEQVHERVATQRVEPVERTASTERAAQSPEWGLTAIRAPEVWDLGFTGEGITVSSIDSGVELEHPALVKHYRGTLDDGTFDHDYNWFDADGICDGGPCDIDDHGTHVTGTMVGDDGAGNQIGVAPGAEWTAANGCYSCSDAGLLASGQWILAPTRVDGSDPDPAQRPHIVNNSWSMNQPGGIRPFMADEIAAWEAAGIFGAWAAGNNGTYGCQSTSSPGANAATYAAGAFSENGEIAGFSSRGPGEHGLTKPNLAAPGENVRSSITGGQYEVLSGTSMASPHLAGAVALLWSAAPVLIGDIEGTRQLLDGTASDVADDSCGGTPENNNVWGEGKLDVRALIENAPIDGAGVLTGTVTDSAGQPVRGVRVSIGARADTTGPDGVYRLGLSAGPYSLTASGFGYVSATADVEVVDDETTTQDIVLQTAPLSTVSGTVTDGSGHGWPLDAKITVEGAPDDVLTWTDPFTGEYSIELPQGATHTLVVQPSGPGYSAFSQPVEVGGGPVTADAALPVLAECTAPGYAIGGSGIPTEEFESGAVPDGWTVEDLEGTGQVWTFDDAFATGNQTGGEGLFAEVNSEAYGSRGTQETTLTTPAMDLSDVAVPLLSFDQSFLETYNYTAVELSIDGGATWKEVVRQTTAVEGRAIVGLQEAGGESDVHVRFHYGFARYAIWWQIDNVAIGACLPVDGGLVAGHVTDRNTGDGLTGTRATNSAGDAATSVDPENPKVDAGYYSLFVPADGAQTVDYTARNYAATKESPSVVADEITVHDVALAAPLLTTSPADLTREVVLGDSASGTMTVTNEGTAPADVEVYPGFSDVEMLGSTAATGVLKGVARDATEVRTAPSSRGTVAEKGGPRLTRSAPEAGPAVTPAAPPSLLATGTTITHSSSQEIVPGGSAACDGGATQWLRTFTLEDFDIYGELAVTNVTFGMEAVHGTAEVTVNLYELDGELLYENLTRIGTSAVTLEDQELVMVDVPVSATVRAGETLVVEVAARDGDSVYIGANSEPETAPSYMASDDCRTPEPLPAEEFDYPDMHLVMNVTGEAAIDLPWLDVQPAGLRLEPGESATVQVDLDSSGVDQPGTYTTAVIAAGGTPYRSPRVPVSLSVTPPRDWGKIAGTVSGTNCAGDTAPLEGAFVVMDGSQQDVTLVTGPGGGYGRWMPTSNNKLTLLSSATGYPPTAMPARVVKGRTEVYDMTLTKFC